MGTEVVVRPDPMVILHELVKKGCAPEQLKPLMDLVSEYNKQKAAESFSEALQKFQSKMPAVEKCTEVRSTKDNKALLYKYADHADIMRIAQPILEECGIVLTFDTKTVGTTIETTCHVRVGTHCEDTRVTLGLPSIPNANDAQRAGAALSYGKKYSACAALNITLVGEDVDGNGLGDILLTDEEVKVINELLDDCRSIMDDKKHQHFFDYIHNENGTSKRVAEMLSKDFARAVNYLETLKRKTRKEMMAKREVAK